MMSLNENGIGGFKEVTFMITGAGAYSRLKYESGSTSCTASSGNRIRRTYPYLYLYMFAIMPEAEVIDSI